MTPTGRSEKIHQAHQKRWMITLTAFLTSGSTITTTKYMKSSEDIHFTSRNMFNLPFHKRCEKSSDKLILFNRFRKTGADSRTKILYWFKVFAEYSVRLIDRPENWKIPYLPSPSRSTHSTETLQRSCADFSEKGNRIFVYLALLYSMNLEAARPTCPNSWVGKYYMVQLELHDDSSRLIFASRTTSFAPSRVSENQALDFTCSRHNSGSERRFWKYRLQGHTCANFTWYLLTFGHIPVSSYMKVLWNIVLELHRSITSLVS